MTEPSAAQVYHQLTSYDTQRDWTAPVADPRIVAGFTPMDPGRFPPSMKRYPGDLPRTPLPRELAPCEVSAADALAGKVPAPRSDHAVTLSELATVLYLAAGVVRTIERNGTLLPFRAAGSAGGRFPLELYVSTHGLDGVADGVHWYGPLDHALVQVAPAAQGEATTVIVTGVPWRTGWKYAERGFRHIYWDAGTMLSQALAVAASLGLQHRLVTGFPDASVAELVGADGVHEFPVAAVVLGSGAPAATPTGPATSGSIDDAPTEFTLVTATQRAGDQAHWAAAWSVGDALPAAPQSRSLVDVILQRGSTRLMRRDAWLPREQLEFAMAAATRGVTDPQFVAVHGVDGVAPGLYRWPDLGSPVQAGDLRDEVERICLDQALGGDAAYVVLSCADVSALDAHTYREALLAAGLVEGRLHLAAYALGCGASGMTYLDSEIAAFVGAPLDALLFTCVGVPAYRNRPGGRPGEPNAVRGVQPR